MVLGREQTNRNQCQFELQSKAELFGVSTDSIESHQEFIKKHGLPFPLLSDSDQEIVKAYQVWA